MNVVSDIYNLLYSYIQFRKFESTTNIVGIMLIFGFLFFLSGTSVCV